jgi:hypothetical protein
MKRAHEIVGLVAALTACAGPPAGGQVGPSADDPRAGLHVYEVAPEQAQAALDTGFVEVSGSGLVMVSPDRAVVSFAMETRAASAAGAASANADAMDRVLGAVRGANLPGLELSTFGYTLQPEYSNVSNQRTREIVAYIVYNNVRATSSDVDAVGRLIDVAIGAGANRVADISFSASDTGEAEREALALAVRDARAQAEVIAQTLGRRLGAPIAVHGGAQRPMPMRSDMQLRGVAFEARAAPTPIEAGEQSVTASVTIRFALGPELEG